MKNQSWRKPTPGLTAGRMHAEAGEQCSCTKTEAILALKKVAAAIGLKAQSLLLLDTLTAFSKRQDWEQGHRPIVWPSNALLEDQTGYARATLKRHLRKLSDMGLIAFNDSSNGKRWGHRRADGHIAQAFGIDLSPIAARMEEFTALYQQIIEHRAAVKSLKREITVLRRTLTAHLEQVGTDENDPIFQLAKKPMAPKPTVEALQNRKIELEQALFATPKNAPEPNPMGTKNEPHIQHTKTTSQTVKTKRKPDLDRLIQGCPNFADAANTLSEGPTTWRKYQQTADHLHAHAGITPVLWKQAKAEIGPEDATTALALIYERLGKNEIHSPAGYLRGMLRKAQSGDLHLMKSLIGLSNLQKGRAAVC